MTPVEEFYHLALEADRKLGSKESRGDPELEPFCLRIVALARAHPDLRTEFANAFKKIVRDRELGAWETILLCMHILRWPEIKDWATSCHTECIATNDWRGEPVYRQILEAYEENWDVDGIFECLRKKA